MALAAAGAVVGYATVRFGSFNVARAYIRGDAVAVDRTTIELGALKAGVPIEFTLLARNLTSGNARITGSSATCGCLKVKTALPVHLEPGGTAELTVVVEPDEADAVNGCQHQLTLFVDAARDPVVITIVGTPG